MFKLIKYLKNSIVPIIMIVGLLIVQAVCDLSLPDYTSSIVNVGIQQGGVENVTPEVIRKSELEKLELFISEEDQIEIKSNYILLDKDSLTNDEYNKYVKDYPALENGAIYKLKTKKSDKETIEKLNSIFGKPMLIVKGFESDNEETKEMKAAIIAQFPPNMGIDENTDILKVFAQLPKEQLDAMIKDFDKKFEDLPNTMIDQAAIGYVKDEYSSIGMDTERMQTNYLLYTGGLMVLIALLSMAATVAVGFIGARIAASLGRNLRSKVFSKVIGFSNTELDKFSTASLITRSTNDIQQIQMLMVMLLRVVFYAPILGIGGIIKVLNTETSMAWIIVVAVVAISAVVIILFTVVMPRFKRVQKLVDRVNLVTREILTGMMVIRAFSTERHEEKRFDKANSDLTKNNLFVNRTMALMMPMMLIMNAITILVVWNGSHSIDAGTMQVGDMMAFIQYTMQIIMAFLMISMVSVMLPRAAVSAGRIDEVLSTEYVVNDPEEPVKFVGANKGNLKFNNVSFKYPNAEENVLSNITFTARPGETTAFIGSTGSGKSTLINLIPRFYDVTEGEILLDGIDIRKVSQHKLREKIGYVPQKGVLFSGTIESNLKYAGDNITDEDMIKASEISQATDFITATKDSYNTEISQGGTNVSGGQKQRLSIARAIAKNPDVYIFDDSFSALDFKTDAALRKALKKETLESTVLIVAQRISTILHAEQIIVLDEGRIAGIGTHKELMKTCDVYKQIALSQLSKEELANE